MKYALVDIKGFAEGLKAARNTCNAYDFTICWNVVDERGEVEGEGPWFGTKYCEAFGGEYIIFGRYHGGEWYAYDAHCDDEWHTDYNDDNYEAVADLLFEMLGVSEVCIVKGE